MSNLNKGQHQHFFPPFAMESKNQFKYMLVYVGIIFYSKMWWNASTGIISHYDLSMSTLVTGGGGGGRGFFCPLMTPCFSSWCYHYEGVKSLKIEIGLRP